jgi:hypothetical protein
MKIKVNGDAWLVQVVTSKQMNKIAGEKDVAGFADYTTKTISIEENSLTYEVIAHELHHAYYFDLHMDETERMAMSDIREIFADQFAAKGKRMVRQAEKIYRELRRGK